MSSHRIMFKAEQSSQSCTVIISFWLLGWGIHSVCILTSKIRDGGRKKIGPDQSLPALQLSSVNLNYSDRDNPQLFASSITWYQCMAHIWLLICLFTEQTTSCMHLSVTSSLLRKYAYSTKKRKRRNCTLLDNAFEQ